MNYTSLLRHFKSQDIGVFRRELIRKLDCQDTERLAEFAFPSEQLRLFCILSLGNLKNRIWSAAADGRFLKTQKEFPMEKPNPVTQRVLFEKNCKARFFHYLSFKVLTASHPCGIIVVNKG